MNKLFLFFSFFCVSSLFSQRIIGTVSSQNGNLIDASIVIKKNNKIIYFDFSDVNGNFSVAKEKLDSITIEISKKGFTKQIKKLFIVKDTKINFVLLAKEIALEEVVIKKPRAIIIKQDTIVYNPSLFKDGTERVVEDLLKKLPGFSVRDNGKIFFKNKEIQSLMLEGDDLFNSQYIIGSKNIPIDLVESIEAVENFNTNKVLQKITESNKVALNLKLKKEKTSLSLTADLQNDFYSKYNNSTTAILLNDKIKGFSTIGLNNLGNTYSFGSIFSGNDDKQFSRGNNTEMLSQGNFPTFLGDNNSLLNNGKYNYTSFIKNLTKKTKANFGFTYYQDKIIQDFINQSNFKFNEDSITIFTRELQTKKNKSLTLNNTTTYYNETDLQVESKFLLKLNQTDLNIDLNNNGGFKTSFLNTDSFYFGAKTELTKKLSETSAINSYLFLSHTNSAQDLNLTPGLTFLDSNNLKNIQISDYKNLFMISAVEFYKNWSKLKLKFSNSTELENEKLNTVLLNSENNPISSDYINYANFKIIDTNFKIHASFTQKNFNLSATNKIEYNHLSFNDKYKNRFVLLLDTNLKYKFNKKNLITPKLNQLYEGFVLNSFRNINNNQSILDYIKTRNGRLSYNLNDIYNTFTSSFGVGYSHSDKGYYQSNAITNDITFLRTVLLNLGNDRFYFDFNADKLIPFLKTTVKINTSYSKFSSFNFINDSELRTIKSEAVDLDLLLYTGFKTKLNYTNNIKIQSNFFEINNSNTALTQIKNEFKIIYKISDKNNFNCQLQTFIPDSERNVSYNFLNFEITHKFLKQNIETYLKCQNLFNITTYEDRFISDFGSSFYSYNLQERFLLLGIVCKVL
jgi:hypothetical protein